MPSYRVTLTVGALRAGVDPGSLLPAASAAARTRTTVEASDLAVVRGAAQITVRFAATADLEAVAVARGVVAAAAELATMGAPTLAMRDGGRWRPVPGLGPVRTA